MTHHQLKKLAWDQSWGAKGAKVEGVEEEDEPLASVVIQVDVHELLLEADAGEPGSFGARIDGHHVRSFWLTFHN